MLAANLSHFAMYTHFSPGFFSTLLFSIGRAKFSLASSAESWPKENKLNRNKTNKK